MNEQPTPTSTGKSSLGIVIAVIAAVLLTVGVIIAVALNQQTTAPATTQQTETPQNETSQPENASDSPLFEGTATITFTNNGFSPSTLTVKKGTKVTVVNNSSNPVQFSSDNHPTHRANPEMNMMELSPGNNATFTANTLGTHGFHDHIDDSKTGTLIVTE